MNPFQKNPFKTSITNTKIVGYNKQFDEKEKLAHIKENMTKLKFSRPSIEKQNSETKTISTKEKIEILKNINK